MENFVKIILEASVTAGVAVFAVMLIRLAMKKAPKRWAYALWAVVFFRCLCPFSVESGFSVFNAVNAVPERTAEAEQLETLPKMAENSEIENILPVHMNLNTYGYQTAAPVYPAVLEDVPTAEVVPEKMPVNKYAIMFAVWVAGAGAMALYGIVSYVLLMGRLRTAVKTEEGVYESDRISTAFSAGFFPPKIYLPCGLFEEEKKLIVAHERVHIRRLDYIVKPVAFLALAVHWFNPLIWLSFALMTRDMELSCDEAVLKIFGVGEKKAYSEALLRVSMKRSGLADNYGFLPLAFAETGIKGRVRNVLKYKKPTVIVTVIAAAVVVAACVVLGTNAKSADDTTSGEIEYAELSNGDGLTEKLTDVNGNNIYFAVTNNYSDKSGVYLSDDYDFDKAFFEAQSVPDFELANAADFDINAVNRLVTDIDIDELKINALEIYEEGGKSFLKAEFNIVTEENPTLFMRDDLIRIDGEYETKLFFVEGGGEKGVSVRAEYELTQNWENSDYVFVLKGFGDIPVYVNAELVKEKEQNYETLEAGETSYSFESGENVVINKYANMVRTYPEGDIPYHQVVSGNENISLDGHIPAYFVCGYSPSSTGVISHSDNADGNSGVVSYESFNNDFEWSFQNAYLGGVSQITVNPAGDNCVHILGMKTKSDFTAEDSVLNFGDFTINEITLEDMYTENSGGRVKLYTVIKVEVPDGDGLMNNMAVNDGSYEMAVAKSADGGYVFTVITEYSAEEADSFGVILEGFTWQKKYVHPDLLLNKGSFYTDEYMAVYENAAAEEVYISDNLISIVLYDNGLFRVDVPFSSYIPCFYSQKQYRREGGSLILTFDDGSELCFDETYSTGELTFNEEASRRTDARSRDIPWFSDGAVFTFDEEWLEVERKSEEERRAEEAEQKLRELDEQERLRAEEALKSSYPALQYPVSANINTAYSEDAADFNKGIDFAVQEGTPVYAAGKGTVISADYDDSGYGLCVIIDHGIGGLETVYAHLSEISVSEGDEVNAGDLIGYSGKTGNTYGAQLHFEVRIDGQHVDPAEYISPVLSYPAQGDISENYGDGHNGIDFTVAKGEEIYAAYDGTVTEVGTGWNGGYGHSVTIDHGSGMETVYAHLSEISVSEGDKVHKRDVIGYAGSTGDSVGTHLHFEVKINGRQANPMNYLGLRHFDGDDTEMETIELKGKTYYLVFTEAQLRAIGSGVYGWDKNYMQQCDIELSSDEWQPIGTRENPFTGSYNGNGFEIKGLTMTDPYASLAGMFGYAKNAKIYNITLRDIEIEKAGSSAESMSSGAVVAINLGSEVYDNTVY